MPRTWFVSSLVISVLLMSAVAGTRSTQAAASFKVAAGTESEDKGVQINDFIPKPITINVGDTVTWTIESTEFHTITFLSGAPQPPFVTTGPAGAMLNPEAVNPAGGTSYDGSGVVNSGLLNKGQSYSLTFTKPGTFDYVCLVHPHMKAQVIVKEAGQPADAPSDVEAKVAPHVSNDLATRALPLVLSSLDREKLHAEGAAPVVAGTGDTHVALFRFLPGNVTIHAGESVTWTNQDPETPHTVTFLAGRPHVEPVVPQPQASGPPLLLLNREALLPTQSDLMNYDGSSFLNSGFLGGEDPNAPKSFTVRFTKPGVYEYVCLLHDEEGMMGTVTVLS